MYTVINQCRNCGGKHLKIVLSLGEQYLTGVFPKDKEKNLSKGPLDLVFCEDCHLLQMKESYSIDEMYGANYGYRSGLNQSMVEHLQNKIHFLERIAEPTPDDIVIDIGSNDATSLKAYMKKCIKVGIDPTGVKFKKYYTDDIELIPDFFSYDKFNSSFPNKKAKIITSIAMFYDLEHPCDFIIGVAGTLANSSLEIDFIMQDAIKLFSVLNTKLGIYFTLSNTI